MRTATVNGQPVTEAAVRFELDRLVKFYANHGISPEEVKKSLPVLAEMPLVPELAALADRGEIENFQGNWLDTAADALENA